MNTFKLTVIQVNRLEVEIEASTIENARESWQNGKLVHSRQIDAEVIDSRLAA